MPESKDDPGLVLRAAQFAAHKHKDQRRKDVKTTPCINHPINLAEVLHTDGGVHDPIVIAAALLHDTIEDTRTTYDELRGMFGAHVADVVIEVTDVKFLAAVSRKRLQVARAGRASERGRPEARADVRSTVPAEAGWSGVLARRVTRTVRYPHVVDAGAGQA